MEVARSSSIRPEPLDDRPIARRGCRRQHLVEQPGRAFGHAPPAAARAEGLALARERHQPLADTKEVAAICRRLPRDLADAVQFMFITGWRSRSEVLPLNLGAGRFRVRFRSARAGHDEEQRGPGLSLDPRAPRATGAPAGDHTALRARPGTHHRPRLPPLRRADQVAAARLEDRMPASGSSRARAPRPQALGGEEPRARRHLPVRSDEAHGSQDRGRVPAIRDCCRERSA